MMEKKEEEKNIPKKKSKNDAKDNDCQIFKVITLGDSGVGKTSIINRYTKNVFNDNTASSVGVSFSIKELYFNKNQKFKLKLLDTCGQEKYNAITKTYLKNSDAVLFVFAANDKDSFDNIKDWMNLFNEQKSLKDIPHILLGNKSDLEGEIDENLIKEFCDTNQIKYMKVSAKKKVNINESFEEIGEMLIQKYKPSDNQKKFKVSSYKKGKNHGCDLCKSSL